MKTDNYIENLEWVTPSENIIHAYKIGIKKGKGANHVGERNTNCKLSEENVIKILKMKKQGMHIKEAYCDYKEKISFSGFEQIWYGYKWKYLVEKVEG